MGKANAQFEVIGARQRRVVAVGPVGRPKLHLVQAHPRRPVSPGRVGLVSSCVAVVPSGRAERSRWVWVKVSAVGVLAVLGAAVSAQSLVAIAQEAPAGQPVAGDPAWAHVTNP